MGISSSQNGNTGSNNFHIWSKNAIAPLLTLEQDATYNILLYCYHLHIVSFLWYSHETAIHDICSKINTTLQLEQCMPSYYVQHVHILKVLLKKSHNSYKARFSQWKTVPPQFTHWEGKTTTKKTKQQQQKTPAVNLI